MSILGRLKSILKAKTNKALDHLEDPEEALNLSLVEMKEKVTEIKKALLEVTTIKKQYEQELHEIEDQIKLAVEEAELSLKVNREDLVTKALEKKSDLMLKKDKTQIEIEKLEDKIDVIKKNKETLEQRIKDFTNKKAELTAMNKAANAQMMIKEMMTGISTDMDDINLRIERAETKIKEKEARLQALDELMVDHDSKDDLENELQKIKKQQRIKEELESLKKKFEKSDE